MVVAQNAVLRASWSCLGWSSDDDHDADRDCVAGRRGVSRGDAGRRGRRDDAGNVWVTDGRPKLSRFSNGALSFAVGSSGSGNGQFFTPVDLLVHPSTGELCVLDQGNLRIQMFTHRSISLGQFSGSIQTANRMAVSM